MILIIIFLFLVLVSCLVLLPVSAEKDEDEKLKEEKPKEKKNPDDTLSIQIDVHGEDSKKIDNKIISLFRKEQEQPEFGLSLPDVENKTSVYLYLDGKESIPEIASKITIDGIAENIIVAKLSLQEMNEIANLTAVTRIAVPDRAVLYNHLVGQGISFTSANTFHTAGIDGTGIKVAIIDVSFFITDPEIASNVISSVLFDSSNFCGGSITCGNAPGNSHGTAVAEIVVDMAPNVDLLLYTIGNSVDFDNAIDDAISKDASIITVSLGFPTAGGDGTTGFFRDGTSTVAKKVNFAQSAGKLVTIAAGNGARSHWMGNYVISSVNPATFGFPFSPYQSVMEFQPAASGKLKACLPITNTGDIYIISWDDWVSTLNDYDVFLYDSTVSTLLAGSAADQTSGGFPIEVFRRTGFVSACLVVASWSSSQNHLIHIDTQGNLINSAFRIRAGSIGTPADATGALAVGAINYATDSLESFSSSGPTDDGRLKPEICGPDGILSHQSGLNPFFGTSSATPHVAGAAALLLDENPLLTNTQLKNKLITDARFNPTYSVNNLCGTDSGALSLVLSPPPVTCGVTFVSGAPIDYGTVKPGLESAEKTLIMDNTGTGMASLSVIGTDWFDGSSNIQMTANKTRFGTSPGLFSSKTLLDLSPQTITTNFNPTTNLDTFWQVLVSPTDSLFAGQLTQTMTFTASC